MTLASFIIKRTLSVIPTIIFVTLIVFVVLRLLPLNPVQAWSGGDVVTPAYRAELIQLYHLNDPILVQYAYFLYNTFIRFDFGISPVSHTSISADILLYFPNTLELAILTILISLIGGILLGIVSALYQYKLPDHLSRFFAMAGNSIPVFWAGLVAQIIFYYNLGWVPDPGGLYSNSLIFQAAQIHRYTGMLIVDSLLAGNMTVFVNHLQHLFLPVLIQSLWVMAIFTRMSRSAMLDTISQDYIRTFRAFGLPQRIVIFKHALRNASIPIVATFGWTFATILGGSAALEVVFSWPGIGLYLYNSVIWADFPAICACTMFLAIIFILVNLACDIIYAIINPRVRMELG